MMMPSITAMPNSATKPIAADTLNGKPEIRSPSTPPKIAIGITLMASSVSTIEPQQHRDQREADRHHDRQPFDGVLQIAVLADPFDPRTCRELDLGCDLVLRFPDRAAEIALAHRELDRQIALLLFPVDVGCARDQVDRCNFA